MAAECPSRGEFTQLVSHHVLSDEQRHVSSAVVNSYGPSMSGMIVEALDQVRITCWERLRLAASTFFASFSSTNGPFLIDLDILHSSQNRSRPGNSEPRKPTCYIFDGR